MESLEVVQLAVSRIANDNAAHVTSVIVEDGRLLVHVHYQSPAMDELRALPYVRVIPFGETEWNPPPQPPQDEPAPVTQEDPTADQRAALSVEEELPETTRELAS